jgi:hypothetical protein
VYCGFPFFQRYLTISYYIKNGEPAMQHYKPRQGIERYRRIIEKRQQESDTPLAHFCHQNNISVSRYYYWRKSLSNKTTQDLHSSTPAFVPIQIPAAIKPVQSDCTIAFPNGVIVHCPQVVLDSALFQQIANITTERTA